MKHAWIIPVALFLAVITYAGVIAQFYYKGGDLINVAFTDSTITYSFDSLAYRNSQLQRLLDSIDNGSSQEIETFTSEYGTTFGDSIHLQLDGGVYYVRPLTQNMYLDRFTIANQWSGGSGGTTVSFDAVPPISNDSMLVLHLVKVAPNYELRIFKRDVDDGISFVLTDASNVFVTGATIAGANFPVSGSVMGKVVVRMKRVR